jgi:DNA-binding phage protein
VIPFKTSNEQIIKLAQIVVDMTTAGVDHNFVAQMSELGRVDQGIYDLAAMWLGAADTAERDEILADLQDSIDDWLHAPREPEQKPYVHFKDLDGVATHVLAFKKQLRDIIDHHGGVSNVARLTGIPQPSLSRMLNSASMPRKTTLYRIANALNLSEGAIVTDWTR